MTPLQLAALKTELTTDPANFGYAAPLANGAYQTVADRCNTVPVGQTVHVYQSVPTPTAVAAISKADWQSLSADDRAWLAFVASQPVIDATVTQLRTDLAGLFGTGTVSRTNLIALAQRLATRAEQLGFGTVTVDDVAAAMAL